MTNRFSIQAIFSAQDKMTAPVKRIGMQVNSFSKSLRNDFRNAQMRVDRMGSALGGLGGYLTAGAIIGFAKKSLDAWNQQAAAVANVEAGIKATNNQLGISSQMFQDMASEWQGKTIFGDEAILQNVTAQLQTFTNIGKDNFNEVQRAALDVTSKLKGINATGEDLRSTSIMLGKAMNDPARGMTALRRVGIQFDATTENLVTTLQRQGKIGEAQAVMLKEIQRQYGGTAEAIGKTDAGMEKMKLNEIGDQMETIGKNLIPIKSTLLTIVNAAIKPISIFLDFLINNPIGNMILAAALAWKAYSIAMTIAAYAQMTFNKIQTGGISKIQLLIAIIAAVVAIIIYLKQNWSKYSDTQKKVIVVIGALVGIIGTVIFFVKAWTVVQTILDIVLSANPIGLVVLAIGALVAAIIWVITHWELFKTKVLEVFDILKKVIWTFVDFVYTEYSLLIGGMIMLTQKLGSALGFDTSGLDVALTQIDEIGAKIRQNSYLGEYTSKIQMGKGEQNAEQNQVVTQRGTTAKQKNSGSRNEVIIRNDSNNQIENNGSRVQRGGSLNLRYSG